MTGLQDKLEEMSTLLREAKDENVALQDSSSQKSLLASGESTQVEVSL